MITIESCLKTIQHLNYEISLKDDALTTADTLISFLREQNIQLRAQINSRSIYIESSLMSENNKENEETIANKLHSKTQLNSQASDLFDTQRQKMKLRFKKFLSNNSSTYSSISQSNRYSLNNTKSNNCGSKIRSKSISKQQSKQIQLKSIQDDLNELKVKIQEKDREMGQIASRNRQMQQKYNRLVSKFKVQNNYNSN